MKLKSFFKRMLLSVFLIGMMQISNSQTTLRAFFIGNSVTDAINLDGLKVLAESKGNTHTWARHMIPGSPLDWLWSHPADGFSTSPYGFPTNAFANYTWDAVSFQPFDRWVNGDSAIIGKYIDSLGLKTQSPNVQIYIYQRWPRTIATTLAASTANEFNTQWETMFTETWSGQPAETRDFFEKLTNAVRLHHPEIKKPLMVPVGEVMYRLNKQMQIAPIDTFTKVWQVYSDGIHMNKIGNYIASCTFYSTLYKADPRGLSVPVANYGTIPAAMVTAIQNTVWEVVSGYKDLSNNTWSGVSSGSAIAVTGVSLSPSTLSIASGDDSQLTADISPNDASNKSVYYSSTNTGVAHVSATGLVTGISAGLAKIIVTTADGNKKDTTEVTVTGGGGGGGTLTGALAEWDFAGNGTTASVATTKYLAGVSTTAPSLVASLGAGIGADNFTGNGLTVSGLSSVTLADAITGNEYITFTITPEAGKTISVDSVKIRPISQNGRTRTFSLFSSVNGFAEANLIGSIIGDVDFNAVLKKITVTGISDVATAIEFRVYISGYDNVWEASGIGNRATGLAENDLIVYGTVDGGSVAVTAVSLDQQSLVLNPSSSETLSALVLPVNASNKNITWTSSDPSIATVDNNGKIIALVSGKTNIIVSSEDGDKKDTCELRVNTKPVASFTMTPNGGTAPVNVTFNCSASSDADAADGDYILGFDWDFGDGSAHSNGNAPTHTYSVAGDYTVSLRVMDNHDLYSTAVTQSITIAAGATDSEAPGAPTALASSAKTQTGFTLSWTASTDNVGVTAYEVFRGAVSCGTTASTTLNITGLTCNTAYTMTVKARDAAGNWSVASAENIVTTAACNDTQAPSAPTNLVSSTITETSFTLSWTASTDNVGVVNYEVFRGSTSCGSTASTSLNISGLTAATTYLLTIKASDAAGNVSVASSQLSVTTAEKIGVDDINTILQVYPNPATDIIILSISENIAGKYSIINALGTVVSESNIQSNQSIIDVSGLPKGTYIIKVISGSMNASQLFIIQ